MITIMLLSHSQKKPIQFKIPRWGITVLGFALCCLVAITCFLGVSTVNLNQTAAQNQQLELKLREVEAEIQQIDKDKSELLKTKEEQELQLQELLEISDQNRLELEELHKREIEIRGQLGLESDAGTKTANEVDKLSDTSVPVSSTEESPLADKSPNMVKQNLLSAKMDIAVQSVGFSTLMFKIQADQNAKEQKKQAAAELRQDTVDYALQFVGGRYVYGGNDPNTGVDCSGFTRYILSHAAGINVNRTSSGQASNGKVIDMDSARPGDLVFYADGGSINHVAMYIGNGKVVHASTEKTGIIVTAWNYRNIYKIVDVIGG